MGLFKKIVKGVLTGGASIIAEKAKKSKVAKAVLSGGVSLLVDKAKNKRPSNPLVNKGLTEKTGGVNTPSVLNLGSLNFGKSAIDKGIILAVQNLGNNSGQIVPDGSGSGQGSQGSAWILPVVAGVAVLGFILYNQITARK